MNKVSSYAAGGRQAGAADENTQVAEARAWRGWGGASGTEADDWALEGLGWEEGRDGDLHLACHVFGTPYPQALKV